MAGYHHYRTQRHLTSPRVQTGEVETAQAAKLNVRLIPWGAFEVAANRPCSGNGTQAGLGREICALVCIIERSSTKTMLVVVKKN